MKNTKIIDIFKDGNIILPIYLIKHYREMNLKLEEFLFLMYLYDLGNHYAFDPNKFCNDLNIKLEDIMNYVSILTDKGFISVEVLFVIELCADKFLISLIPVSFLKFNSSNCFIISNC